jgi:DNA-binding transcriptional MerR regulator/methylmalonyl-CoA mutase cobalamin-binding subunit
MKERRKEQEELHPIKVVARRTGLSPDVLRAWERRYEAITPSRAGGSRRLYSNEDVERLTLLRRTIKSGRGISQVAGLSNESLRALLAEDEAAARALDEVTPPPAPALGLNADRFLMAAVAAVKELDVSSLETSGGRALISFGPLATCETILVPLMRKLGSAWQQGSLGIVHEHMASAVIRTVLGGITRSQARQNGAPGIVVATPSGTAHELGAMMAVVASVACGWNPTYLGPNLPADEIAAGAVKRNARAIALGITYPPDTPLVADQLLRLHRAIPHVTVIVGGDAIASYGETLDVIRAKRHETVGELRETLAKLAPEAI